MFNTLSTYNYYTTDKEGAPQDTLYINICMLHYSITTSG